MAIIFLNKIFPLILFLLLTLTPHYSNATPRKLLKLYKPKPSFIYHNGTLLQGKIPISILWYGSFTSAQKSIVTDFILSLTPPKNQPQPLFPSVSKWWRNIERFYLAKVAKNKAQKSAKVVLSKQVTDASCSLGKSLTLAQIPQLAAKVSDGRNGGIALVLTSSDIAVEGFGMSRCGLHSFDQNTNLVYAWVGNSETQCPGQCAWPFHQPVYGPQTPPLVAPNGDIGLDGLIINLATLVAGSVTNPYGEGFYQGVKEAPLEAATACPGVFAKGAYPGYAGECLVDDGSGCSYNSNGVNGRRYLLPALFDPSTSTCTTLV